MRQISGFVLIATLGIAPGCSKGSSCQRAAEQHCSRYSDGELTDMWGSAPDKALAECTRGYKANCEAEQKYKGNIPADAVIDPNQ